MTTILKTYENGTSLAITHKAGLVIPKPYNTPKFIVQTEKPLSDEELDTLLDFISKKAIYFDMYINMDGVGENTKTFFCLCSKMNTVLFAHAIHYRELNMKELIEQVYRRHYFFGSESGLHISKWNLNTRRDFGIDKY